MNDLTVQIHLPGGPDTYPVLEEVDQLARHTGKTFRAEVAVVAPNYFSKRHGADRYIVTFAGPRLTNGGVPYGTGETCSRPVEQSPDLYKEHYHLIWATVVGQYRDNEGNWRARAEEAEAIRDQN